MFMGPYGVSEPQASSLEAQRFRLLAEASVGGMIVDIMTPPNDNQKL